MPCCPCCCPVPCPQGCRHALHAPEATHLAPVVSRCLGLPLRLAAMHDAAGACSAHCNLRRPRPRPRCSALACVRVADPSLACTTEPMPIPHLGCTTRPCRSLNCCTTRADADPSIGSPPSSSVASEPPHLAQSHPPRPPRHGPDSREPRDELLMSIGRQRRRVTRSRGSQQRAVGTGVFHCVCPMACGA